MLQDSKHAVCISWCFSCWRFPIRPFLYRLAINKWSWLFRSLDLYGWVGAQVIQWTNNRIRFYESNECSIIFYISTDGEMLSVNVVHNFIFTENRVLKWDTTQRIQDHEMCDLNNCLKVLSRTCNPADKTRSSPESLIRNDLVKEISWAGCFRIVKQASALSLVKEIADSVGVELKLVLISPLPPPPAQIHYVNIHTRKIRKFTERKHGRWYLLYLIFNEKCSSRLTPPFIDQAWKKSKGNPSSLIGGH